VICLQIPSLHCSSTDTKDYRPQDWDQVM